MNTIVKQILGGIVVMIALLAPAPQAAAGDAPESLTLDSLSRLYEGVDFDHEMHLGVTEDCTACHHHTTGTPATNPNCAKCHDGFEGAQAVACQACHPAEPFSAEFLKAKRDDYQRYHIDQLGLKAAYHQNCMGCHQEMDGPVGCQDCHQRNEAGDALFHAGDFAPKTEPGDAHH